MPSEGERRILRDLDNTSAPRVDMTQLVTFAWGQLKRNRSKADDPPYDHHAICVAVCDEFGLYAPGDMMPTWLMRVVEGIMRDASENGEDNIII